MPAYNLYIFDLDGTLYRGSEALPHAAEVVDELKKDGAEVRFLTNNSGQTREFYANKLRGMGIPAQTEEIYSSAVGAGSFCRDEGLRKLFAVGEPGLISTLESFGLEVVNRTANGAAGTQVSDPAQAVVAGIHRDFSYEMMEAAMTQVLHGARFLATNTDATYPLEGERLAPGAGAIVASLRTCTQTDPLVLGKPNPFLIEMILRECGVPPSETLVVGDRFETDIESGIRAGCDTHLVLTGVTKEAPAGQRSSASLLDLVGPRPGAVK